MMAYATKCALFTDKKIFHINPHINNEFDGRMCKFALIVVAYEAVCCREKEKMKQLHFVDKRQKLLLAIMTAHKTC